jgi:hypothetical protein
MGNTGGLKASQVSIPPMLRFPAEIMSMIANELTNSETKIVRLVNRQLKSQYRLRFYRIFISPTAKDLEVLLSPNTRSIAKKFVRYLG